MSPIARGVAIMISSLGLASGISTTVALALAHQYRGGPATLANAMLSAGLAAFVSLVARRLSE